MFLVKQDLKAFPFQMLHEKVTLAGRKAVENMTTNEEVAYERFISRKEQEWVDSHEYPDEGTLRETHPYDPPSAETLLVEKNKAENAEMLSLLDSLGAIKKAPWLLPQITAYIGKLSITKKDGKINSAAFLKDNFRDDWHYGLYRYCTFITRGKIVPTQITEQFRNYGALVPLLMMPFKKFDGIKYSDWDLIPGIADPNLYNAMTYSLDVAMSKEDILEDRALGLVYKTGEKAGTPRSPISSYKLFGCANPEMHKLPWLVQVMLTQIWLAHPSIRTSLMILDWKDWDNMPDPLITEDVFIKPAKPKGPNLTSFCPWDE